MNEKDIRNRVQRIRTKNGIILRTGLFKKYLSNFHGVPTLPRTPALPAIVMLYQSNDVKEAIQSTKTLL
jgi:hypothetical protein